MASKLEALPDGCEFSSLASLVSLLTPFFLSFRFYHAFNKVPRSHFAPTGEPLEARCAKTTRRLLPLSSTKPPFLSFVSTDLCDLQIPVLLSVFLLMQSANMRFAWSVIRDGLGRAVVSSFPPLPFLFLFLSFPDYFFHRTLGYIDEVDRNDRRILSKQISTVELSIGEPVFLCVLPRSASDVRFFLLSSCSLHLLDIQVSSMSGRPPNLSEDRPAPSILAVSCFEPSLNRSRPSFLSFDVELEFNPEFWKDGEVAPHGQPSRVQAFVLECQLSRILARVCEQLVSSSQP